MARRPAFGTDFGLGWVGFVHGPEALSAVIGYLTRHDKKKGDPTVTHSFLVAGPDLCVEADFPAGVVASGLEENYFSKPEERLIVFRQPRGLTPTAGRRLAKRAEAQVGAKFDYGGFVTGAVAGSFLGHLLDSMFGGKPKRTMAKLFHRQGAFVCSDLVAYCLRQERRWRDAPSLSNPPGALTPQALFEDEELFAPAGVIPAPRARRSRTSG